MHFAAPNDTIRSLYHWVMIHLLRKEGNILFNDTLNTLYLRLYRVRYMVKDHSDSERGNPLPPHGFFYMYYPRDRIAHTTAFVIPNSTGWNDYSEWI